MLERDLISNPPSSSVIDPLNVAGHMTVSKRSQDHIPPPMIFQSAPLSLADVGFVSTWGGILGKE